ncbi:MAG: NADH dehydrogenase (quinone) subunit D [Opitutales bacterium]
MNLNKIHGAITETTDDKIILNVGPSHPMTHGVLRLVVELDGDVITRCDPVIGQLHRGSEKVAENMTYNQFVPYTDRLDYLSPLSNNVAYIQAVEMLGGIEVPERCKAIRVICCELSRIANHLLGMGVYGMDAGALTVFMYCFTQKEKLYTLFESLTGARLTTSYTRVGGLTRDIPEGWLGQVRDFCNQFLGFVDELDALVSRNRIFVDRTADLGVISPEMAMSYNLSGPNLRASGVDTDLRKSFPYLGYEDYEFDVAIGTKGDCYDRWLVRIEEMRQSVRIVKQAIEKMPSGAWHVDDRKVFLPTKKEVLTEMSSLIQDFTVATQGVNIRAGNVYFQADNPKGNLGFYIESKGGGVPYRVKIEAPSFASLSILPELLVGHLLTDATVILGSLDFVMGECDR